MADEYEVKSYLEQVITQIEDANIEAVRKIVLRVQERTQMNIRANDQIDTGFMVNSVYVVLPDGSDYQMAARTADNMTINRAGESVDHAGDIAPEIELQDDANGAVACAANYAIFQEQRKAFLAPAAEQTAAELGGEIVKVFRDMAQDPQGNWQSVGRRVV